MDSAIEMNEDRLVSRSDSVMPDSLNTWVSKEQGSLGTGLSPSPILTWTPLILIVDTRQMLNLLRFQKISITKADLGRISSTLRLLMEETI